MRRDRDQCKDLWLYAGLVDAEGFQRLHHVVGVKGIPKGKETIIIVDESDEIIMRNPVEFASCTLGVNLKVVCLTATPDDGLDDGCERNLMNLMGYRLIRTGSKQELEAPKIDTYAALRCANDVMVQVEEWIYTRAVLIYANGDLNDILANEYKVTRVTADTPEA